MPSNTKRSVNLHIQCRVNRDEEYGCGMYDGCGRIYGGFGFIEFDIGDHWSREYDGKPSFAEPELDLDGDGEWPRYLKPLTDYYNMEITDYGWNGYPRTLSYKFKNSEEIITPKIKDDHDEDGEATPCTLLSLLETLGFEVTVEEDIDDWDE